MKNAFLVLGVILLVCAILGAGYLLHVLFAWGLLFILGKMGAAWALKVSIWWAGAFLFLVTFILGGLSK